MGATLKTLLQPTTDTKQHAAEQVLTGIKMSKSVLRGPQLTGEMCTHRSQNKMEKVRITDFHPQSLKQKQGWRLQLLGEMEGHSENVVPERKKNRNRKQDPQTLAFAH